VLQEQLNGALTMVTLVIGGAIAGGLLYGAAGPRVGDGAARDPASVA
jgi:hypothetical protein